VVNLLQFWMVYPDGDWNFFLINLQCCFVMNESSVTFTSECLFQVCIRIVIAACFIACHIFLCRSV